jgi:CDP-diacylglycerol--glycerol-3-phosphate 3-phosphatidyltransferase
LSRIDGFKREVLNLPNMITIGRIFLIPPVLLLIDQRDPVKNLFAMMLFLFASLLDIVDGWLARRQGLVTFFGKFMDPLADKIMAMALLIYLVAEGRLDPWVVIVLIGREFYMSGLRTLALAEGVEIVAGAGGKAKTAFQMIGISFILLYFSYRDPIWGGTINYYNLGLIFVYVSLVASIWSAIGYTVSFGRELSKRGD